MSENIRFNKNSYLGAEAITPNDSADLPNPVSGLYIASAGSLHVLMASGEEVTFTAVPGNYVFDIAVKKVFATGTTASNMIGLK